MKYTLIFTDKRDNSQLISCAECDNISDTEAIALQLACYLCYNQTIKSPKKYYHLSSFSAQVLAEAIEDIMDIKIVPFNIENPIHKYSLICQKMKPLQITENKSRKEYTHGA